MLFASVVNAEEGQKAFEEQRASLLSPIIKGWLTERSVALTSDAVQVHGGMGFTDLVGLHYWFKRIGANRQWLGAPEFVREEAAILQGI